MKHVGPSQNLTVTHLLIRIKMTLAYSVTSIINRQNKSCLWLITVAGHVCFSACQVSLSVRGTDESVIAWGVAGLGRGKQTDKQPGRLYRSAFISLGSLFNFHYFSTSFQLLIYCRMCRMVISCGFSSANFRVNHQVRDYVLLTLFEISTNEANSA